LSKEILVQTVLGHGIQDFYLVGLIIMGGITIVSLILGDILDAIADITVGTSLNLTMLFSFFAILCGAGYILEYVSQWGSLSIFVVSFLFSFVSVLLMKAFVLVPISRSEQNTAFRLQDFTGQTGEVLITIPNDGIGEVLVRSKFGNNGMPARSADGIEILQGSIVSVVEVNDGILVVKAVEQEAVL
jgi:membrane protein implicated in regulation of membrane protease activity